MTMWWQQNTCIGFFQSLSHAFCWEGNEQLYLCTFHSANYLSFVGCFFFDKSCLEEQKNPKAVKHFISLWNRHIQRQQMGYYTINRFGWIPSPTWIWSRFSFNELNFLSGVDFGLVLDVMGDFCIYFMYRRQSMSSLCFWHKIPEVFYREVE